MRHVLCTHRVDLERLYDRINSDPMIQIKYVNTTQQLTEILTKGSFTRDRWTKLTKHQTTALIPRSSGRGTHIHRHRTSSSNSSSA